MVCTDVAATTRIPVAIGDQISTRGTAANGRRASTDSDAALSNPTNAVIAMTTPVTRPANDRCCGASRSRAIGRRPCPRNSTTTSPTSTATATDSTSRLRRADTRTPRSITTAHAVPQPSTHSTGTRTPVPKPRAASRFDSCNPIFAREYMAMNAYPRIMPTPHRNAAVAPSPFAVKVYSDPAVATRLVN